MTDAEHGRGSRGRGPGGQKEAWPARCTRWLYELLLSLYFVLELLLYTPTYFNFEMRVRRLPAAVLRLTSGLYWSNPGFSLQYLTWFLMAGILFIILRILAQIPPLRTALCQLVGSAVFFVPIVGLLPVWATMPSWWMWLWLEEAVAVGCALLYASRTRPRTAALLAVAALTHFGLWGFVYFRSVGLVGYFETVDESVLLPLFGSLAWALYVWLVRRPVRHQ